MNEAHDDRLKILVVDDEAIVLSLVRDALEDEDYEVSTAARAGDALAILESRPIDLIVTDIRMPDMNGIDMARRARMLRPEVGVVFMTGYANINSAKDAIKEGALDYVLKPFELDEIRRAINTAAQKLLSSASDHGPEEPPDTLSDHNRTSATVGDGPTLCVVSTRLAMMHCGSNLAAVLVWDKAVNAFTMITLRGDDAEEETLPQRVLKESLERIDSSLTDPLVLMSIEEHPLYRANPDPDLARCLAGNWHADGHQVLLLPVGRSGTLFALIMIDVPDGSSLMEETSLELLRLITSQLALSLEQWHLLEEKQAAFSRLKSLQDQTV